MIFVEIVELGNRHWFVYLHGPGGQVTIRYTNNGNDARREAEALAKCLQCEIEECKDTAGVVT